MASAAGAQPKDEEVIRKRLQLFQSIQERQKLEFNSRPQDPIKITLPDGTVKEGKRWSSTPWDIAKEISNGLASNALISQVNGVLWDMKRPLENDCQLKLFTFDSDEGCDTFWRSSALILAQGFYYEAFFGELSLNATGHFKKIEAGASKAVKEAQEFERIEVTKEQALEIFCDNKFKVEIINDMAENETIAVYGCGPFVDLCGGPHIPNTSFVKAFACLKACSAYSRRDKNLQRVYGISYPDQKRLEGDHRILGTKQQLFFLHHLSPGSWFFLTHGTLTYNKLEEFLKSQYIERGYDEVKSPNMYNMDLWEKPANAERNSARIAGRNYRKNMFLLDVDKTKFGLKSMNCHGHCLNFKNRVRSYRELPLRLAEFGPLHRNEASDALTGLSRVQSFEQDGAHIFCMESQIKDEVRGVLEFIDYVYKVFGFTYELKLSTRPKEYIEAERLVIWGNCEDALIEALNEFGKPWQRDESDGALCGPKIDIHVSDALKRKHQLATLELDFELPEFFELKYSTAEDERKSKTPSQENKLQRPILIHGAILGSLERIFAILLEHYSGKWPFWLSPRQAIAALSLPSLWTMLNKYEIRYTKQDMRLMLMLMLMSMRQRSGKLS
ncbi:Threonine--tRNA ligase, mitochondrial 1 [Linum grandiflorum]